MGLTGSVDATARLWDVASGKLIGEPFVHESDVNAVAFSPEGEAILTATKWKTHLWDAPLVGQSSLRFQHQHWVGAVAFSPDGKTILTGTRRPESAEFTRAEPARAAVGCFHRGRAVRPVAASVLGPECGVQSRWHSVPDRRRLYLSSAVARPDSGELPHTSRAGSP